MNDLMPPIRPNGQNENTSPPDRRVEKVTKGKVTATKQSLAKKALGSMVAEDISNAGDFFVMDVLVPFIKDSLIDMLTRILWGGNVRGTRSYRPGYSNNQTNYSSYSYNRPNNYVASNQTQNNRDFRELIFETRTDAEEVIGAMMELMDSYGQASVADLYDACGITGEYTDNKWGWQSGAQFYVRRVAQGYTLDLPKVTLLK